MTGVVVTAKPDQRLEPLPEGASYLGFVFAEAPEADAVEAALRAARSVPAASRSTPPIDVNAR